MRLHVATTALTFCLLVCAFDAQADLKTCAAIAGRDQRLDCFDKLAAEAASGLTQTTVAAKPETNEDQGALRSRRLHERNILDNPFGLTAYKPNYILPFTYNSKVNEEPFRDLAGDANVDSTEAKFQISIKAKLWEITDRLNLMFGYTQESWWQVYNSKVSAPFRETNYQPELFFTYSTEWHVLGMDMEQAFLSFNHQSNGRSDLLGNSNDDLNGLSRSWNRIIAGAIFDKGNFVIAPRVWYRIPERERDDDNPATDRYYGWGDLRVAYAWHDMTFATILRDNFRTDENKGAVQLDWSFPLNRRFKGYVQYFYGYGESMIDYDAKTNRIGVGIMLTDWI